MDAVDAPDACAVDESRVAVNFDLKYRIGAALDAAVSREQKTMDALLSRENAKIE